MAEILLGMAVAAASAVTMVVCIYAIPSGLRWLYNKYCKWRYSMISIRADSNSLAFSTIIALSESNFTNNNMESILLFRNENLNYFFIKEGEKFSMTYRGVKINVKRTERYTLDFWCDASHNNILMSFVNEISKFNLKECNSKIEIEKKLLSIRQLIQFN